MNQNQEYMRYGIMGASLSAQTVRHDTGEVVGYVEFLRRHQSRRLNTNPDNIKQYTYGGNRLSDGGLIRFKEILADRPDVCILEPLVEDGSRGRWTKPNEILDIYGQLIQNEIIPVTFLVPLPAGRSASEIPITQTIKQLCNKYNLPLFEANINHIVNAGGQFQGVHTSPSSGALLAEQLAYFLFSLDFKALLNHCRGLTFPPMTLFFETLSPPSLNKVNHIRIDISPANASQFQLRIIQKQQIGKRSPVISTKIYKNGTQQDILQSQEISVWDPHCHYDRDSFVTLCNDTIELDNAITIETSVAPVRPKYETCKREVDSWPLENERSLFPKGDLILISTQKIQAELKEYK